MCTDAGAIFDHENILEWLAKHGTNPTDGASLRSTDLVKLSFAKNDDGEYVDPVTFKVFTDNTHIVALKKSGNVFAWDTVERLNIKAKNWRDLVSDDEFSRKDIITLQDPQNVAARDFNSFKHVKDGDVKVETDETSDINPEALSVELKIQKSREAMEKYRLRKQKENEAKNGSAANKAIVSSSTKAAPASSRPSKPTPYNAAQHTTGKAAASFTSTGLTPHTSGERATLTEEEYMLKPKRVKNKGFARIRTNHGELNIELQPEFAPRAVWNFVRLSKKGYYNGTIFHRNIRNFMIQGGDPTGTGRGGTSIWNKTFNDEFEGPNKHDARGIVSMANKGKNTNSSQFFIVYRPTPHLDRKHTIFGRVVGGLDTLSRLENVPVGDKDRPKEDIEIKEVVVYVDPFEEFQAQRAEVERKQREEEEVRKAGGRDEDKTTWTGKRIRADGSVEGGGAGPGVGKYLKAALEARQNGTAEEADETVGDWDGGAPEPIKKRVKTGGFGNFDNW